MTALTLDPYHSFPRREKIMDNVEVIRTEGVGPFPDSISEPMQTLVTELQWTSGLIAAGMNLGNFDIVHGHDVRAVAASVTLASQMDSGLVFTKHSSIWSKTAGRADNPMRDSIYAFVERIEKWGYGHADAVVTVSGAIARQIGYQSEPAEHKVRIIPNSTDLVHSGLRVRRPFTGEQPIKLLYVGRLSHEKGVDIAISALPHLKDLQVSLDIFGDGPDKAELVELCSNLEVDSRVHFFGNVPSSKLPQIYEQGDIVVVPSRWDAGPIVVCEAQAMGRLVIGADIGGISEQIDHGGTGLLVDTEDAEALADAIRTACSTPAAAQKVAERGQDKMRSFSWRTVAERTEAVYFELIEQRAHDRNRRR